MKEMVKYIVGKTYRPWLVRYLSRSRLYSYRDIRLEVPPQVFHPGFFHSTRFLLRYLSKQQLSGKNFLELGAGSGLLGIYAARRGAIVTATDINLVAVEYLKKNTEANGVKINILHSDLFNRIPVQPFDLVAINPPYYKKNPRTDAEYAWYCGESGEYFRGLFAGLGRYLHGGSQVLMVLCDACDIRMIRDLASKHGFMMICVANKSTLIEKNFIYRIEKCR